METKFHNHLADGTWSQHWRNKKRCPSGVGFRGHQTDGICALGTGGRPSVLAGGMDDGGGGDAELEKQPGVTRRQEAEASAAESMGRYQRGEELQPERLMEQNSPGSVKGSR